MAAKTEELRDAALELFRAARETGEYEVAYHALCATLHAAESLNDRESCQTVERLADDCNRWLDANAPQHKLSPQSAAARGHESIFNQLVVTATSARLRMEYAATAQSKRAPGGRPWKRDAERL